jgi:hypothetical protein
LKCSRAVADVVLAQFQILQVRQRGEVCHRGIGQRGGAAEVQPPESAKLLQLRHPAVGDARLLQRQVGQLRQAGKVADRGVGDGLASEHEFLEVRQPREHLDVVVARRVLVALHADDLLAVVPDAASQLIDQFHDGLDRRRIWNGLLPRGNIRWRRFLRPIDRLLSVRRSRGR